MRLLSFLLLLSFFIPASADDEAFIPPLLQPWEQWALYDYKPNHCPSVYNRIKQEQLCAWAFVLALDLDDKGGYFKQTWLIEAPTWITLPGSQKNWPLDVKVNGLETLLSDSDTQPRLFLEAGEYTVEGGFRWDKIPEQIQLPQTTGLVNLKIKNKLQHQPDISNTNQLWLRNADSKTKNNTAQNNSHSLKIYRKISDGIPLEILTVLDLRIAGDSREITIGPVLLPELIPLAMNSRLPAKLEADGRLRIQARPGQWQVTIKARLVADTTTLSLPQSSLNKVTEEVWAFQENPLVRLVELQGLTQIDQRQTSAPKGWAGLPLYRVKPGQSLIFDVKRRGNPEMAPNSFVLKRQLWLDFDGQGFTVSDQISGTMNQAWRLNMAPPYALGRVSINGQNQVITHHPQQNGAGVEIRNSAVQMIAESRLETTAMLGHGWDTTFKSASGQLSLPPGWQLIAMRGVDHVSDSWIKRWSLLDIFIVLIIVLAINKLWSIRVASLALLMLVLTWHEAGAPHFIWLNLVTAIALWRALPEGRIKTLVNSYRWVTVIVLLLMFLVYAVDAVREGLYPQLEQQRTLYEHRTVTASTHDGTEMMQESKHARSLSPTLEIREAVMDEAYSSIAPARRLSKTLSQPPSNIDLQQIDPSAKVGTGPGMPRWSWQNIRFSWNGPVDPGQRIEMTLISPAQHLIINLLGVVLMAVVMLALLGLTSFKRLKTNTTKGLLPSLLLGGLLLFLPQQSSWATETTAAGAQSIPSDAMLQTLRTRLIKQLEKPPKCAPRCAHSPELWVDVEPERMTLRMRIHAQEEVAIPLPIAAGQWLPSEIFFADDRPAAVTRHQGQLYLLVAKGIHEITLRGALPQLSSIRIPLPLNPYHVQVKTKGWQLHGVDEGKVNGQFQLLRQALKPRTNSGDKNEPFETQTLPPFVKIERTFVLGLEWSIQTSVTRLSPGLDTISLQFPLLEGESVLSTGAKVKQGQINITLTGKQSHYRWQSSLKHSPTIALQAATNSDWVERWRLRVSPAWRVAYEGIPEILQQSRQGQWAPEWWPWPGETLQLAITRPEGVTSNTLTVDSTQMKINPGKRATETTLNLVIRSSQGTQKSLSLPPGATLQKLHINGVEQPIRQSSQSVPLNITPGSHNINLVWLDKQGAELRFVTPSLDLAMRSVNNSIEITLPRDRWILFTGGPQAGPAVLFWGVMIVFILIAIGLGYSRYTPLKIHHWLLLFVGFSQLPMWMAAVVVSWFFLLAYRGKISADIADNRFNRLQVGIILTTLLSSLFMIAAIWQGLLGSPEMQIIGNGSQGNLLKWYQDASDGLLPTAWVISLPLFVYRLLMLAWALWLAFALLRWIQWGSTNFSQHGLWRKGPPRPKRKPWGFKRKEKKSPEGAEE